MNPVTAAALLPMEGTKNTRDLGGYPTTDGHQTLPFIFLRTESTSLMTPNDIDYLTSRGLTTVIDLRSSGESSESPSVFLEVSGIRYENIPMLDNIHSNEFFKAFPTSLFELYRSLLEQSKDTFAQVFHLLAECEGTVMYNCTAGKDRTGLVSMLLLCIAGVEEMFIIDDYAATEVFLQEMQETQRQLMAEKGIQIPEFLLRSEATTMVSTLQYIRENYGSAEMYLLSCGVNALELYKLKERFVTF